MKQFLILGLIGSVLFPLAVGATDATYVNNGTITFPEAIDATNVINTGVFDFSLNPTFIPYDTSNTRNFTNSGTMIGAVGFRFDNAPNTGQRKLSANFHNRQNGRITATDSFPGLLQVGGTPVDITLLSPSYLLVASTNIINEGVLTAGAGGILRLVGSNVNLSTSGMQIAPISARGSENGVFTNYFTPEIGIYSEYWGQTNQVINSGSIIQAGGGVVVSPPSQVNYPLVPPFFSISGFERVVLVNPVGAFYTNALGFTNYSVTNATGVVTVTNLTTTNVVQAVFVGLPQGDNINWDVRFFDSTIPLNPFKTVTVMLSMNSTNLATVTPEQASIFLVDTLASETNRSFYTNFTSIFDLRPQNYLIERLMPFEYFFGFQGNAPFATDLFYNTNFVSRFVTNEYAAYSAFIDSIASRPPRIPEGTVTNLPGRIEVLADTLDVSRTRFRADGLLNLTARHLVGSASTVVDCENLSYTLGSTNGNLKIQNLAKEAVARFQGTESVWSGVWTNQMNQVIENWDLSDTNAPPKPANITNIVEYRIYGMLVDGAALVTQVPVVVNAMVTHSTNVVINDKMTVVQSFLIDGQSFTLNGGITFSNTFFTDTLGATVEISLKSWVGTNAPNLKYFTNTGTLNLPSEGHFGDDRPIPYATFVNKGTINAYGQTINSDYCELGGNNTTTGDLTVLTRAGKIEGGAVASGGDGNFYANTLKFSLATIQATGRLDLSVTNALFDSGGGARNSFLCGDGFRLLVKPQSGDLLGTSVNTVAPAFAEVEHVWAGEDRGPNVAGFINNTALGNLTMTPGDFEDLFPPLFVFMGTGASNALYVDELNMSQLLDFQSELQIEPNLVIYFASAKLGFTPPLANGAAQQAEEYLDGQFNGRLRWVRDFAGPNSSVDVIVNGHTAKVNRALRNSRIIDSDGDGLPNYFDPNPFDLPLVVAGDMVQTNTPPARAFRISWTAVSNAAYCVEYTGGMPLANWQELLRYTNTAPTNRLITIWDTNVSSGDIPRFYRVGHLP